MTPLASKDETHSKHSLAEVNKNIHIVAIYFWAAILTVGRRGGHLAPADDRGYLGSLSACSLRLAAQDVALSRRKQGFEFPRERQ